MFIYFSRTDLSFDFRASNPDGIILYTAIDNEKQADFIVCNLLNGKVSCGFSAGGGILQLTSPDAVYSDGTWHTVSFVSFQLLIIIVVFDICWSVCYFNFL